MKINHSINPIGIISNVYHRIRNGALVADIDKNIIRVSMERLNMRLELADIRAHYGNDGIAGKPEIKKRIEYLEAAISIMSEHIDGMQKVFNSIPKTVNRD